MRHIVFSIVALLSGWILLSPQSLTAQNQEATTGDDVANADKPESRSYLPTYFGKLGVGDAQRERLYAIDDDYAARIAEIEKQIQKLEDERDAKMEALLTPGQKLRLQELREAAAKKAEAQAAKEAAIQGAADKPAAAN